MKDKETLHRKVLELVDCFATTDPLKEMSVLKKEEAEDEAPLKWIALAVLHGINAGAKEISVVKSGGTVRVLAEYGNAELPTPGTIIGERIFESLRRITHLEEDKGKTVLAMGVREGSIDLGVKIERNREGEKLTLKFPEGAYTRGTDEVEKTRAGDRGPAEPQGVAETLDYCRFAAAPEHERAYRVEEPCDDARSGGDEKQSETPKRAR